MSCTCSTLSDLSIAGDSGINVRVICSRWGRQTSQRNAAMYLWYLLRMVLLLTLIDV